jgi:hypothetical protein
VKGECTNSRSKTKTFCYLAIFLVLGATLYPFDPFPNNGVAWLTGARGIRFEKSGVVISDGNLVVPENSNGAYSLELLLRPAQVTGSRTILGFYVPNRSRQLLVRQFNDGLLVTHDSRIDRDPTRTIKFDVDHIFYAGALVQITLSSGSDGTTVYVDGRVAEQIPSFKIFGDELSGQIVLGTSPVTYRPWSGEMLGLAVYGKQLMHSDVLHHYRNWVGPSEGVDLAGAIAYYSFIERTGHEIRNEITSGLNLEIPEKFLVPHKEFLASPVREFNLSLWYLADILMNIFGFIPLGVIVCLYFLWTNSTWRAIVIATIICASLSLGIEILQFYIPRRDSGITDIITNSLGGLVGAMFLKASKVRRALTGLMIQTRTPT